ncbi:MAG: AAA family ATPase [Bryobacter sp.]|nr:AAA family ATPase [Bryobacter sp.]
MGRSSIPTVQILIGLPGSGKSTWAAGQTGAVVLSSDATRILLCGDETNQTIHGAVFRTLRFVLRERLRLAQPRTIIDATNLRRRDRKPFLAIAAQFGARAEAIVFAPPLEVVLTRNAQRSRVVPPEVIQRMATRFELPTRGEGFARITSIGA